MKLTFKKFNQRSKLDSHDKSCFSKSKNKSSYPSDYLVNTIEFTMNSFIKCKTLN